MYLHVYMYGYTHACIYMYAYICLCIDFDCQPFVSVFEQYQRCTYVFLCIYMRMHICVCIFICAFFCSGCCVHFRTGVLGTSACAAVCVYTDVPLTSTYTSATRSLQGVHTDVYAYICVYACICIWMLTCVCDINLRVEASLLRFPVCVKVCMYMYVYTPQKNMPLSIGCQILKLYFCDTSFFLTNLVYIKVCLYFLIRDIINIVLICANTFYQNIQSHNLV